MQDSNCRETDKETFFGAREHLPMSKREVSTARSICYGCPVRRQCLMFALANEEGWGVWGGLTGPERQRALNLYKTVEGVMSVFDTGWLERKVALRGPQPR